jgi:hypothetical protein
MCKLYFFSRYFFTAASVYSVVVLSVQRFMAVRKFPSGATCQGGRKTTYVVVATVWALSFILSLPHGFKADVLRDCFQTSMEGYITADLIVFCIVPVILVAVFSGLTAARIRRSAGRIPGEGGSGQERLRHKRIVSSTVLTALAALFVVSYTPYFLFTFLFFEIDIAMAPGQFSTILVVTNYLRYVICCFNPLVLFVMSKSFRAYVKDYICCGERK